MLLQMSITNPRLSLVHLNDQLWNKGSLNSNSLLRFDNLFEWLTKLRKTDCILDYWFIIQGYNSGTVRCKRCIRQGFVGRGMMISLPTQGGLSTSTCSPTQKLSESSPFEIFGRLHYKDTIVHITQSVNSGAQSYLTLCYLMDCSTPGLPVHH